MFEYIKESYKVLKYWWLRCLHDREYVKDPYKEWISVEEALPIIPKGSYGIPVLAVTFDHEYVEDQDDALCGYDVQELQYGIMSERSRRVLDHDDLKHDFLELYVGNGKSEWGPPVCSVTHWRYLPEPPIELPKWYKKEDK